MKLNEFQSLLRGNPDTYPRFILPDGEAIPAHFHITEVGHVAKKFVDCGGTFRNSEACVLQTYVARDLDHRLTSGALASIIDLGRPILPNDELDVEVEWDCCVTAQYPIATAASRDDRLEFVLTARQTDCLAKDKCGVGDDSCGGGTTESACC